MSVIKLPRSIFLLIWHNHPVSSFPLCALQQPCIFAFKSCSVAISSHILSCFYVTAFLTGTHPDIRIVREFSFSSVFRIVCQILSSSFLRTIPYHVTVVIYSYSKVFVSKILFALVMSTFPFHTFIWPCRYFHCTIYSTFAAPQFVSNSYFF